MKISLKSILAYACLIMTTSLAHADPITLLNDTFDAAYLSGGDRDDARLVSAQDLPYSANWFVSYPDGSGSDDANVIFSSTTNQGMTLRNSTVNVTAYFTEDRSSFQSLNIGDSLTLTFTISVLNPASVNRELFVSLLNSGGNQLDQAYYVTNEKKEKIAPFSGYIISTNPGESASTWQTVPEFRNAQPSDAAYFSLYASSYMSQPEGDADPVWVGTNHNSSLDLTSGVTYEGTLMITRTGIEENQIYFSLNGVVIDVLHTDASLFSFDTVNFGFPSGGGDSMTLNNIKVEYRAIPESSAMVLLVFAGMSFFLLVRRKKLSIS